jgi:hypothetical protein
MPNYDELIKQSQVNVNSLSEKLKELDKIYQEIIGLKAEVDGIPEIFNDKFLEIIILSEQYTNNLGIATKDYLDGNNTLFTLRLNELSILSEEFKIEINRLIKTDFYKLFEDLQNIFIEKSRKDLAIELDRLEEKSKNIQVKIDYFEQQIRRIEAIDLENHFDKLQKTLSEIFGAINTINLTLLEIIQKLPGILQLLGTIQTNIDTNHNQTKQLLSSYNQIIKGHLIDQDNQATKNFELLERKINSVIDQNILIRKEGKSSRIIQIIGFTVIILILLYVAIK